MKPMIMNVIRAYRNQSIIPVRALPFQYLQLLIANDMHNARSILKKSDSKLGIGLKLAAATTQIVILGFVLIAHAVAANTPPTIGAITNQSVIEDQPTPAYMLALNDAETPVPYLQLSGASSDPAVVPPENIFFGLAAGNWYVSVTPRFGLKSGTATITVTVSDGLASSSTNFVLTVNPPRPGTARFYNSTPVSIPSVGAATPYASQINVTGRNGVITNMTLTLSKLSHPRVGGVNMLLVSPGATNSGVVVFSHVSGNYSAANVTVHLTDSATYWLPSNFALWPEPLRPADYATNNFFPGAPAGPYGPVSLSTFNGLPANGAWSLYVYDDVSPASGRIDGGWSLVIGTDAGGSLPPEISTVPDQLVPVNTPKTIPFVIADQDTPVANLTLSANSSNPTLVPLSNIVFGGSGTNRTATVTPAAGQTGTAVLTLTVSDGTNSASYSFTFTVCAAGTVVQMETAADGKGVSATDQQVGVGSTITVFAVARDTTGNFVANVAAESWSLVNVSGGVASGDLVPSGNQKSAFFTGHVTGSAKIRASCAGISALASGTVTVLQSPPPVISPIADQTTLAGISAGPFPIVIRDPATNVDSLTVTGTSSSQTLVPNGNISIFNGYGVQTLTVTPAAGQAGTARITVSASDGAGSNSVSFLLTVNPPGGGTAVFGNTSAITIPLVGPATNYPSPINVAGVAGTITDLTVTLHHMSHTFPGDVDMLLVGPMGQGVVLFSTVAVGIYPMADVTFSLSDGAYYSLPSSSDLSAGTYKPTDNASNHITAPHIFPAPAPSAPFATALGAFSGSSPNGTWSLYVLDTQSPDAGGIAGGWSLAITTVTPPILPPTILSLAGIGTTNVVISWSTISNLTYQVQYRSGLATTNWVPLQPTVTAASIICSAVDHPVGNSPRFYRILMLP